MMYCSRCKQPLTKSMFACGCGTMIPGRQLQPATQTAATQATAKPQTAAKKSTAKKFDKNKVSCAYCGYEVDKNNIPGDWVKLHPIYMCPYCKEKKSYGRLDDEYRNEHFEDYCRNNGFAEGSVTELTIPQGFISVSFNIVCGVSKWLEPITKLVLPEGLRIIDCANLPNLTEVYIPHSCELIASHAFSLCKKLKSVVIPENVTHIGRNAFNKCTSLKTVTIPESVVEIGEKAFAYCSSLSTIIMESSTPPIYTQYAFANNAPGRKVIVPKGSLAAYKNAPGWGEYAKLLKEK